MANATTPVIQINEGKVGIGTSSPVSVLSLEGQQNLFSLKRGTAGDAQFFVSSDSSRLYFTHTNSQFATNGILKLDAGDASATFASDVTATANYTAGNSKIIYKAQRNGGAVAGDWSYDDATTDMSLGTSTAHAFSLKTGDTRALTLDSSQNATFAGNVTIGDNSASEIFLAFNSSATDFALGANGSNFMIGTNSDLDTGNLITLSGTNGRLGINSTGPLAPLHLVTPAVAGVDLTNISRTANNLVRFTNPQYSTSATMGLLLRVFPDSDARQGAGLLMTGGSDNAASNLSLFVSKDDGSGNNISISYSALHIAGNTSNVGIGTTSPGSKLQIYSTATRDIFISGHGTQAQNDWQAEHAFFISAGQGINIGKANANNNTNRLHILYNTANGDANYLAYNTSNVAKIHLSTNGNSYLNGGNIGIGTTTPDSKLNIETTKTVALSTAAHFLTLGLLIDDTTAYSTAGGGGGIAFRSKRNSSGTQTVFAAIDGAKEGTANDGYTGMLRFYTNQNSTGVPLERMRIDSAGAIKFNAYNSTNQTGSPTHILGTDANGLVVKSTAGSSIGPWLPLAAGSGDPLTGDLYINKSAPLLRLNDSGSNVPYELRVDGTTFSIKEVTNSRTLMSMTAGAVITLDSLGSNTIINTSGAMVVPNGNVGIGLTSAATKLDIGGSSSGASIRVKGNMSAGAYYYGYMFDGTNVQGTTQSNIFYAGGSVAAETTVTDWASLRIDTPVVTATNAVVTNNYGIYQASDLQKNYFNGNIGIGTASPTARLDVLTNSATGDNDIDRYVRFRADNGEERFAFNVGRSGNNSALEMYNSSEVQKVKIASSGDSYFNGGNVGIGVTSPSSPLHVDASPANGVYLSYLYNSATHNSANGLNVQTSSNNILTYGLRINTAGDSNALAVMGNGNVGIGTASPSEKLTLQVDAQNQAFSGKNGTDYLWFLRNEAGAGARQSGRFQLMDTNVATVNIESASNRDTFFNAGKVGIGTTNPGNLLDVAGDTDITGQLFVTHDANYVAKIKQTATSMSNASYTFEIDSTSHTSNMSTAGAMSVDVNGGRAFTITGSGLVGIGTNSPSSKLTVIGTGNYGTIKITNSVAANANKQTGICSLNYIGNSTSIFQYATNSGANTVYYGSADGSFRGITQHSFYVSSGANTVSHSLGMQITSGQVIVPGNMGIGNTLPQHKLDVSGTIRATNYRLAGNTSNPTTTAATIYDQAAVGLTLSAHNTSFRSYNGSAMVESARLTYDKLVVVGDVIAYGSPSDKRLKENIKPIESALDKAMKLQGVTFDWKKSDSILDIKEDIGFIAQDVKEVVPELVRENKDGMLSMRHQGITPILLEAIKELKAEIEELKKQIK